MNVIKILDYKNYDENWTRSKREAVRGIVIKNDKIALVKSEKEGFYKFPGGGIEDGESHLEALIRETKEETGLKIIPESIKEYGLIHEIKKSNLNPNIIFDHKSYYYYVDVESEITDQNLNEYEKDLGYSLVWVDIKHAYEVNCNLSLNYNFNFLYREVAVLKELIKLSSN